LIEVVEEKGDVMPLSVRGAIKERQYADDYLDEGQNSAKAIKIRTRILNGSRRYLEQHFFQDLEKLIKQNPREARLGGVPTVLSKVKAYVNIRSSRKDLNPDGAELQLIDGDFCWVIVFFLLRSGHVKEATEYVTKNAPAFRAIDRNFVTYITSYHSSEDRRLKRDLQERISSEYSQRQRIAPENTVDPYRMACYKIIGRCDLIKRSLDGLPSDVEDWIWLQFSMAREVNRVEESEVFGLQEVRAVIKDIGQRHFGKGGEAAAAGFGTFFFLQILGGMYEQAVAFLYPHSYMSAVHFAIALEYYGLLRASDFTTSESELCKCIVYFIYPVADDAVTFNTKQLPQINFGRMLGYYTRDFRSYTVTPAVDYLTLICLNSTLPGAAGSSQTSLCHAALRELVLETREFSTLLGDVRADGVRIAGAIEARLKLLRLSDTDEFLRTITIQAASVANDNGRTTDAVLLYHLAEDYDNVITIINRALSEAVAIDIGQDTLRLQPLKPRVQAQEKNAQAVPGSSLSLTTVDDPAELARNMIGLYNRNALYFEKIKPQNRETCGVLLRMNEAKDLVAQQQWASALDVSGSPSYLIITNCS
jgi:nuclear pore complex protein Nup93